MHITAVEHNGYSLKKQMGIKMRAERKRLGDILLDAGKITTVATDAA